MPESLSLEIENLDEIQAKLSNPDLLNKPLQTGLERAASAANRAASKAMDGGTGVAVRSVTTTADASSAAVYTAIAEARSTSIDEGRPTGAEPRSILAQVIRWKDAVGIADSGWEVAAAISRSGAQGKNFKEAAREAVQSEFPTVVSEMSDQIVTIWESS